MNISKPVLMAAALLTGMPVVLADLPDGYWPEEKSQAVLDTTLRVGLAPDLSNLTGAEVRALRELLAAGRIMNTLYERQLHRQSAAALKDLQALHAQSGRSAETANLLELFYLFKGRSLQHLTTSGSPSCRPKVSKPARTFIPMG